MRELDLKEFGLVSGLILLMTFAAYWPCLRGDFVFDDRVALIANPIVTQPEGIKDIWLSRKADDYWPVTYTGFWLQWKIAGRQPTLFHVVSVFLHGLNAILLWLILRQLNLPGEWIAASIFAVHPVAVESVAWIIQQKTLLATTFAFACILRYVRPHPRGTCNFDFLTFLLFVLSLLSKSSNVMLPFMLLGLSWHRDGRLSRANMKEVMPYFIVSLVLGLAAMMIPTIKWNMLIPRTDGFLSRLIAASWAMWFYLGKDIFPIHLSFTYPRWKIDTGLLTSYLPLLATVVAAAVCIHHRKTWGLSWVAGFVCFLTLIFPVLGFVNIPYMWFSLVADHWQYTPFAAVVTTLVVVACNFFHHQNVWQQSIAKFLAVIIIASFWMLTMQQSQVYSHRFLLWADTISKNPHASLAHNGLANYFADRGNFKAAKRHFQTAVELKPDDVWSHLALAGLNAHDEKIDTSIQHIREALRVFPEMADFHIKLGVLMVRKGKIEEAIHCYQAALKYIPTDSEQRPAIEKAIEELQKMVNTHRLPSS